MQSKQKVMVINVLGKEYFNDCRIKGSISVPIHDLKLFVDVLDRAQPIVVYCANYHCNASREAWYTLDEMGFSNLWAYDGGVADWKQAGLPTEGPCALAYLVERYQEPEELESQVRTISREDLTQMMQE